MSNSCEIYTRIYAQNLKCEKPWCKWHSGALYNYKDGAKTDSDYDFVYAFYLTGTSHFDAQVLGRVTLVIFVIIPRIYIFIYSDDDIDLSDEGKEGRGKVDGTILVYRLGHPDHLILSCGPTILLSIIMQHQA